MKKADQTIAEFTDTLALKKEYEELLNTLKGQATKFEEFIRNQSPTKSILVDAIVSSKTSRVPNQCVSNEDLMNIESPPPSNASCVGLERSAEKRLREDMARAMAAKVKAVENEFKGQIVDFEQKIDELTNEVCTLQTILKERETDVSNLKTCILKERFEVKNILEQKETEHTETMKKHQNTLLATRHEVETAKKRIASLLNELELCKKQFHAERESMKKLTGEWKTELAAFAERETNLIEQMRHMDSSHRITVESLNEKYVAAKKTAANYKRYSEEKEKHIERESERIKVAYETALKQMKENMKVAMKDHEKRANKRIAEMQTHVDAVMQKRK